VTYLAPASCCDPQLDKSRLEGEEKFVLAVSSVGGLQSAPVYQKVALDIFMPQESTCDCLAFGFLVCEILMVGQWVSHAL
jgi:hypothetical protein